MAIDLHTARALVAARSSGVEFGRTATLGRQNLYLPLHALEKMFREHHLNVEQFRGMTDMRPEYAEDCFTLLGAKSVVSIDASSYEGASEIHDMNTPLPDRLRKAFDVVVDGGTLEHVFNFPVAIQNAMELVRVGGHLFLQTPANNFFGHGFYQFSPELFYRVLCPANGFVIEQMLAYESYPGSEWFEVADPATVRARVELIGSQHRILLLVHARRTAETRIFAEPPQQSDYAATWESDNGQPERKKLAFGIRWQPGPLRRAYWFALRRFGAAGRRAALERRARFFNRQLGLRVQPDVFRAQPK